MFNPSTNPVKLIKVKVPKIGLKGTFYNKYSQLNISLVTDSNNTLVPADIMCDDFFNALECSLYFYANVSSNSLASYKISLGARIDTNIIPATWISSSGVFPLTPNKSLEISSDLENFVLTDNGQQYPFNLTYNYYESYWAENQQASGAYIFRPTQNGSQSYGHISYGQYFMGKVLLEIQV